MCAGEQGEHTPAFPRGAKGMTRAFFIANPNKSLPINAKVPLERALRRRPTSSLVKTTGKWAGFWARSISLNAPGSIRKTALYRKTSAFKAWFWVEAATFRLTAKWVRKAGISGAPLLTYLLLSIRTSFSSYFPLDEGDGKEYFPFYVRKALPVGSDTREPGIQCSKPD